MNWIQYALISAIMSSIWSLSVKEGVMSSFSIDFNAWYSLVALIISLIFHIYRNIPIGVSTILIIAGFMCGLASICLTRSVLTTPNPGMTMAIFRTQGLITAFIAFIFLGSSLSYDFVISMILVIIGVFIIINPTNFFIKSDWYSHFQHHNNVTGNGDSQQEIISEEDAETSEHNNDGNNLWLDSAILAALFMTCKDIFTKLSFHLYSSKVEHVVFNVLIGQTLLLFIYDYYKTGDIKLRRKNKNKYIWITLWTGLVFFIYLFTLTTATKYASNIGYVKSIDSLGIILTTILARYLYKSRLTKNIVIGIVCIITGVSYLSIKNYLIL